VSTPMRVVESVVASRGQRAPEAERQEAAELVRQLRALTAELALAEERDRRRLALRLHDRIGEGLALARLRLETLKRVLPKKHYARLDELSGLLKQLGNETRSLTVELSPPALHDLGLPRAIAWLADHVRRELALPVEVRGEGPLVEVAEDVRLLLFRSLQELLASTVRHGASRVVIQLESDGHELRVVIEDDGAGGGFPLAARERLGHLGGRLTVESLPGGERRVLIAVPGRAPGAA
jgi:signal transduction histidine kinase